MTQQALARRTRRARAVWLLSLLVALAAMLAGAARADELADGMKAVEQKDFVKARTIFTRLAEAGNAQAQQQLGELYGYGDGVPEDRAVAEQWLRKSLAGGNQAAAETLARLDARGRRRDEIAFYTTRYDGADVQLARYNCEKPNVPKRSETRDEMRKTDRQINDWLACYQRFTDGLAARLPVGKAIPQDLADLMSVAEFAQARARMSEAYRIAASSGKAEADAMLAARTAWVAETEQYVKEGKLVTDNMFRIPQDNRTAAPPPQPMPTPRH